MRLFINNILKDLLSLPQTLIQQKGENKTIKFNVMTYDLDRLCGEL